MYKLISIFQILLMTLMTLGVMNSMNSVNYHSIDRSSDESMEIIDHSIDSTIRRYLPTVPSYHLNMHDVSISEIQPVSINKFQQSISFKAIDIAATATYTPHATITILSNSDFATKALNESWPGSGIKTDPYIISGYSFSGSASYPSIDIRYTDIYFVIRDNIFTGGYQGIHIEAKNANVENNFLNLITNEGIAITSSSDILIMNNTIDNSGIGAALVGDNITFQNNIITYSMANALNLVISNSTIIGNYLDNNGGKAISIDGTSSTLIKDNIIQDNGDSGITLGVLGAAGGNNVTIQTNTIQNNAADAILIEASTDILIDNNIVLNNTGMGIGFNNVENSTIQSTIVGEHTNYGISISGKDNYLISNTIYNSSFYGVFATMADRLLIQQNQIYDNLWGGINLAMSDHVNISGNQIHNNKGDGFWAWGIQFPQFSNNQFYNNSKGIYLSSVKNATINSNSFQNHDYAAVYLFYSNFTIIEHNSFENDKYAVQVNHGYWNSILNNDIKKIKQSGIYLHKENYYSMIAENMISNSSENGIFMVDSLNATIRENTISDSKLNGIMINGSTTSIIIDNIISTNEDSGITVYDGSYLYMNNNVLEYNYNAGYIDNVNTLTIQNNVFSNSYGSGIVIMNLPFSFEYNNVVEDNKIQENGIYGGYFNKINETKLLNNIVNNNLKSGIRIFRTQSALIEGNDISSNGRSGLKIDYSSILKIKNNTITKNTKNGIDESSRTFGNDYIRNYIDQNGKNGIYLFESNYNGIYRNVISNNGGNGIDLVIDQVSEIDENIFALNGEFGVFVSSTCNITKVRENTFITNFKGQIYDSGRKSKVLDNYFNDWLTPDADDDGIVDIAYPLAGYANNTDPLPHTGVTYYPPMHFLAGGTILFPNGNEIIDQTVIVKISSAFDSFNHSITYNLYYSSDKLNWLEVAKDITDTSYNWDVSSIPDGSYWLNVTTEDGNGLVYSDISDTSFLILTNSTSSTSSTSSTNSTSSTSTTVTSTSSGSTSTNQVTSSTTSSSESKQSPLSIISILSGIFIAVFVINNRYKRK